MPALRVRPAPFFVGMVAFLLFPTINRYLTASATAAVAVLWLARAFSVTACPAVSLARTQATVRRTSPGLVYPTDA